MILPPEILAILAYYTRWLDRAAPKRVRELIEIGVEVHRDLERRLKTLKPGKFTTTQTAEVLVQVRAMLEAAAVKYGDEMGDTLQAIHVDGAKRGRESLEKQLAAWEEEGLLPPRPASEPPAPPPPGSPPTGGGSGGSGSGGSGGGSGSGGSGPRGTTRARPDLASELLDPGLLELHEASRLAYGEEMIAKLRRSLARGVLANETIAQTSERMASEFEMPPWRAERIVRTEQSFAFHRRQILDLRERWGEEADERFGKQLLAVHDDRTGEDSKFVDLQIQRLPDLFQDNEGRRYPHPPNRPNDREKMVLVPMREVERFEDLARDPSNGGLIGPNSRREAQVALGVERAISRGDEYPDMKPPLRRSPDPRADFIDAAGQPWDVKGFVSNPPEGEGGAFNLEQSVRKIRSKLERGIKVIVDTARMSPEHIEELRNRVQALNWGHQVVYFIP